MRQTAMVYAYALMPYCPTLVTIGGTEAARQAKAELERNAAAALFDICRLYERKRGARVYVRGRRVGRWLLEYSFDHRVHVEVLRGKEA